MRRVLIALVVLAGLGAGWYWGSPWWTLREMRVAAEARDADRLAGYVDFPALRQNLKAQMRDRLWREMRTSRDDVATIGSALGLAFGGRLIDAAVTPSAVQLLFLRDKEGQAGPVKVDASRGNTMTVTHMGFDQFELSNASRPHAGALIFSRDWLGWRLSGVRLPDKADG